MPLNYYSLMCNWINVRYLLYCIAYSQFRIIIISDSPLAGISVTDVHFQIGLMTDRATDMNVEVFCVNRCRTLDLRLHPDAGIFIRNGELKNFEGDRRDGE